MKREILKNAVSEDLPVVYMTKDITPEGLMNAYLALDWNPEGKTAVKLSTGEPPASNYLRPELIQDVVQYVDGTIVECNTASILLNPQLIIYSMALGKEVALSKIS